MNAERQPVVSIRKPVISAALATLLAIQFGFTFVLLAALVLYGWSLLLFTRYA